MIVRVPEADKLKKELPEEKRKHILEHKYAFVCFKSLDGPAKKAVAKVPYLKLEDEKYNQKIEEISKKVNEAGVGEDDMYKCACYIMDNNAEEKIENKEELERLVKAFKDLINDNDGVYMIKSKEGRLDCCQALKKAEREKKLKQLYEKIKKKIKDKYKFCNLYVKNLPNDFTDEKLKELFGKFGEIRSAKVVKKELESHYLFVKKSVKVFGFVCFFEPTKAQEAKSKLKQGDKAGAKRILAKKKKYVDQIKQIEGAMAMMEEQKMMLESALSTKDMMNAIKAGTAAVKDATKGISVEDLENMKEDMENIKADQEELNDFFKDYADQEQEGVDEELEQLEEQMAKEEAGAMPEINKENLGPVPAEKNKEEEDLSNFLAV